MAKNTLKFQRKVLRFLCRPENKRYVELYHEECFDAPELKLGFEVLRAYIKDFGSTPDAISAVEYLHGTAAVRMMKPEVQAEMAAHLETLFEARDEDVGLVMKTILDYAARKRTSELVKKSILKIKDGGIDEVKRLHGELGKIAQLDQRMLELETGRGGFLLADHLRSINEIQEGRPCFLKKINRMTAAGGFKSPELIILLSGPKGFKTGLALNLAVEYVRDGLKVYYADFENGYKSIKTRAQQVLMNSTRAELLETENIRSLQQVVRRVKSLGGDLVVDKYEAYGNSVGDVEQVIREMWEQHAWKPDVIVWDYPDLIRPIQQQRETHENITRVYLDINNLNNRLGCFSIGVSQVNRGAVEKEVFTLTDLAGDFRKAAHCHSCWALCRTPEEVEAGIGRIVPVVQREGVRYKTNNVCFVKIDEAHMHIEEIDARAAAKALEGIMITPTKGRGKKPRGMGAPRKLTDD